MKASPPVERGTRKTTARRAGVTVVELLVAGSIFTIVLTIATNFFIGQSRASNIQKATNEATEAARTALSLLTWDIQNAGYRVIVTNEPEELLGIRAVDNGAEDGLIIRYLDESLSPPQGQRISYDIGGEPRSLRRVQYEDVSGTAPAEQPTVATVVAMNLTFETRPNQYVDLNSSDGCTDPAIEVGDPPTNCLMPWVEKPTAERLVRQVRIELLARSATKISGYSGGREVYDFSDGSTYTTEPGYAYHQAEQTVLASNLGR